MSWIKKRYDQFVLVLAALALLGLSGMLALRAKNFSENFAAAQTTVVPGDKIPELDLSAVKKAEAQVAQPVKWEPAKDTNKFVFAADRYIIDATTSLPKRPKDTPLYKDSLTGKDIPSSYFLDNGLALLDPGVPKQDPDKDGFTNEDEWRGDRAPGDPASWSGSTDPNDPKAHPKLHTKLFLKQWIRIPFRLLFQAYDGDPAKPEEMSFQINAVDRGRKTAFLKIGEKVANSPYILKKFELKMRENPKTKAQEDVSELTVTNTETNDDVILVKGQVTDSPDSSGLFDYQITGKDIQVKKLQEFVLLPDTETRYKLVDIKEGQALIQLPGGENYIVTPDSRPKKPPPGWRRLARRSIKSNAAQALFHFPKSRTP
jgi:hypothetical protein